MCTVKILNDCADEASGCNCDNYDEDDWNVDTGELLTYISGIYTQSTYQ